MSTIYFDYKPLAIHESFHRTAVREKALIGAVGSGKTIALCADAVLLALTQPGSRIIVFPEPTAPISAFSLTAVR